MEYTIQNVVDFSAQGKATEAKAAVTHILTDKVRDAIAGIRDKVGQEMFKEKDKDPKNEVIQPAS